MTESILLVDYENVGKIDLDSVPEGVRLPFFFGASQKTVATQFLKSALRLGNRFEPIDIEGHGKNALDFHVAFYLGEHLTRSPRATFVILSKDKGFDPLIRHLNARGFSVRRASTLAEAFPPPNPPFPTAPTDSSAYAALALKLLSAMQKNKRPRKRKGLVAYLHNHFSKKLTEADVQVIVDRMIASKKLADLGGSITYNC